MQKARFYLTVPFAQKDEAKGLGTRWDPARKLWYVPEGVDTAAFHRWFSSDPKLQGRIYGKPGLNCYYLGLNCSRPPFNSEKIRQAVNMAIDRKRLLETVYEKRGVLAAGPVPPPLWKFDAGPKDADGWKYDPEEARRRIRDALEGRRIRIYSSAEAEILDLLEVIQQNLSRAGLKAEIVQLDWSAYKEALNKGEADAFWLSWWADYPDPENFFNHRRSFGQAEVRTLRGVSFGTLFNRRRCEAHCSRRASEG